MSIYKTSPIVKYNIYGKMSKRQIRFELHYQKKEYAYLNENQQTIISSPSWRPLVFNTQVEVFKKGNSYLQTKHLRTLLFYSLLANYHNNTLPRITYYAFPDK